ncbi:hypothetical protein MMC13_007077 [Lambiella insularis]|nr:hypothetical protein [Lambiella insularis]
MNGYKAPRRQTALSQPLRPFALPILPFGRPRATNQAKEPERSRDVPSLRNRKNKIVVDSEDDYADDDDKEILLAQIGTGLRSRRKKIKMDEANERVQSSELPQPHRITRAAAKATSDIRETAEYLLSLGSSSCRFSPTEQNSPDARGLLLLAEAAAWSEAPDGKVDKEQDAQARSPMFCEDEPDLVTLRESEWPDDDGDERDSIAPPRYSRRPKTSQQSRSSIEIQRTADDEPPEYKTRPTSETEELEELTTSSSPEVKQDSPGRQRLRELLRSSLRYRNENGEWRRLSC